MTLPLSVLLYRNGGKRALDFCLSFLGLFFLSPLACLLSLALAVKLGVPATFCQYRLGKNGKRFLLHKFRTMRDAQDQRGRPLPDEQRMTRFGSFVRSTSLDELPQLFDVLRGEMSLVGPRPLLVEYRDRYTQREWRRHFVRPGITGWTAVNGRNTLTWDDRFEYDLFYVDNYCFSLDVKILFLTVAKVFQRSGVTSVGEATSTPLRPEGLRGNPMP